MDDRGATFPLHQLCEPVGSDAAPIAQNIQRKSALVVYCGGDQHVSEGFGIALREWDSTRTFCLPALLAIDCSNTEDN
ncbi:MAG: hypothetical protein QOD89_1987 [Bradyrhizobium sp.]|nr:hypothetical protein [Bradyrhizobium sp.]